MKNICDNYLENFFCFILHAMNSFFFVRIIKIVTIIMMKQSEIKQYWNPIRTPGLKKFINFSKLIYLNSEFVPLKTR